MSTSHAPDPEEKKEISTIREALDKFVLNLPIGMGGSRESIQLFPINPHFNAAVESIFDSKFNPGTEWHFVQALYQASLLPLNEQKEKAKKLLEKYVDPNGASPLDLGNLPSRIMNAINNGGGLDSFLPILTTPLGSGEYFNDQVVGNIAQNNRISPERAELLRTAYDQDKQDKLMLPIRTVICKILEGIQEVLNTTKPGFFKRTDHEIKDMKDMRTELNRLLEASTRLGNTEHGIQKLLIPLVKEMENTINTAHPNFTAHPKPINADSPKNMKLHELLDMLTSIEKTAPAVFAAQTSDNAIFVQKYMAPIEKRMQEESIAEQKEPLSPRRPGR